MNDLSLSLIVLLMPTLLVGGCTEAQRAAIRQQQEAERLIASRVDQVIITPGDLSRPYDILGNVEYPPQNYVVRNPCTPYRIKYEAIRVWGTDVDAVIGYMAWPEGGNDPAWGRCSGTAVTFKSDKSGSGNSVGSADDSSGRKVEPTVPSASKTSRGAKTSSYCRDHPSDGWCVKNCAYSGDGVLIKCSEW